MTAINKENLRNSINLAVVLKGALLALGASLLLSFGSGIAYHFMSVTELILPWFAAVILAVSSFTGSLAASREAGNMGLYYGLAVGLLFFLAVWLAAGLLLPGQAALGIFYKLLITLSAAALGGIIGVGLS